MDEFSSLLQEEVNSRTEKEYTDRLVENIEDEFKAIMNKDIEHIDEDTSREREKEEISKKIKGLYRQLTQNKNIKNHRLVQHNSQRAENRKRLRKEIELCKLRLQEIEQEVKGKEVNPSANITQ